MEVGPEWTVDFLWFFFIGKISGIARRGEERNRDRLSAVFINTEFICTEVFL